MRLTIILVAVTVLSMDQCGNQIRRETVQQRQDLVNLCEQRGGIPILNAYGTAMERCEFPPVAPNYYPLPEARPR